ncbi:AMP-binding protein [Dactylosporangium vinaceum]|uniref:AMP-binding protein n=1 Tax=Dactylosporangium vinaceum TaxID=53362 RepID=A0ABV5M5V5_9ACTN|nr:AMP-binding protein [Dactylosporangium vinaceum]UAC01260.1 AMP-binding protein [Dactylosporangium vinaceum]
MTGLVGPGATLVDAVTGETWSGERLTAAVEEPGLLVAPLRADGASVLRYLGALAAGRPVLACDPAAAAELTARFGGATDLHPQLALMLATSGSTGRPRLVRHSRTGVVAAATAIVKALHIGAGDVAITSLPLFHVLGLSVLHSHLLAGATVVLEPRGVLDAGFWASVERYGVTAITGVPHTFELLARLPWEPARSPSVRSLAVSGGRLRDELVGHFHAKAAASGGAFYSMYGQTEAGSRICVLPPEHLPAKAGCVGPPVDGMDLAITADGEVVCRSAAVMLGYAETAADLARGDDLGGVLHTGDRGRLDADGHLWLAGRRNRIGKAYGVRVDLDAVELAAGAVAPAAALAGDDRVLVWCEGLAPARGDEVARRVAHELGIHRTAVRVTAVAGLPRRANGKVDYDALPV